jgi:hypothetical protein
MLIAERLLYKLIFTIRCHVLSSFFFSWQRRLDTFAFSIVRMMEAVFSSELLLPIYPSTRYHNLKDSSMNVRCLNETSDLFQRCCNYIYVVASRAV